MAQKRKFKVDLDVKPFKFDQITLQVGFEDRIIEVTAAHPLISDEYGQVARRLVRKYFLSQEFDISTVNAINTSDGFLRVSAEAVKVKINAIPVKHTNKLLKYLDEPEDKVPTCADPSIRKNGVKADQNKGGDSDQKTGKTPVTADPHQKRKQSIRKEEKATVSRIQMEKDSEQEEVNKVVTNGGINLEEADKTRRDFDFQENAVKSVKDDTKSVEKCKTEGDLDPEEKKIKLNVVSDSGQAQVHTDPNPVEKAVKVKTQENTDREDKADKAEIQEHFDSKEKADKTETQDSELQEADEAETQEDPEAGKTEIQDSEAGKIEIQEDSEAGKTEIQEVSESDEAETEEDSEPEEKSDKGKMYDSSSEESFCMVAESHEVHELEEKEPEEAAEVKMHNDSDLQESSCRLG